MMSLVKASTLRVWSLSRLEESFQIDRPGPEQVVLHSTWEDSMGTHEKKVKAQSVTKHSLPASLQRLNLDAAGIDVGATEHYVAVPSDRDEKPVRRFGAFTADLQAVADWLTQCGIQTVAMESTGVYWIPLFQILEARGFQVFLVNARQVKNVPGRKTDIADCQWLQQLHTYGLLSASFRPEDLICRLRSYLRHRENLIRQAAIHTQHMQKAMNQMNLQLHHVISDLTGVTGLSILDAILAGERNPATLAALKDRRIQSSHETIAKALEGDYREEHLFVLKQALSSYRFCQEHIADCDREVERLLTTFDAKVDVKDHPLPPSKRGNKKPQRNEPKFDLRTHLYRISGVDLTQVNGLAVSTAQTIVSEIGLNIHRWPTEKQFASWLGLCPDNRISGGKILKSKTRHVVNRAACAFRLGAQSLKYSQSALGAYYRRMRARLGAPKAITATAHKLARIVYHLLKHGQAFVDQGETYYEERYRKNVLNTLRKRAEALGYQLIENPAPAEAVS